MLETLREYAGERVPPLESERLRGSHARHFAHIASRAETALWGPEEGGWMDEMESEHDNLRVALSWLIAHDADEAAQLAADLVRFWYVRGHFEEGTRCLHAALAASGGVSTARGRMC